MSLVNLAHVCSHITNASKARLSTTSVPYTKLHQNVLHAFRHTGLISSVVLGGATPPPPHFLLNQPSAEELAEILDPVTKENIASRRLWVGLKYWQSEPLITKISLISKPTRRVTLDLPSLRQIVRGNEARHVDGLRSPGECIFLSTSKGVFEARENDLPLTGTPTVSL
ncbi:ribosomal protein subunit S8 [Coccidioides immitis RMSCC 2394]|uniref:Ribosomal protein subunit S8 n=1 Tax=Coccidioides immitis RMSCC 2394 TaxID=404692 RepID=A0A0J6YFE9_COCIT|nr:ribosomal protein subunit S8 [Coccidioides immitis RMSCC 2394]